MDEQLRLDVDNAMLAMQRLRRSLAFWRGCATALDRVYTATLWLGFLASSAAVVGAFTQPTIAAAGLVAMCGLAAIGGAAYSFAPIVRRRLDALEDERRLLDVAVAALRHERAPAAILAPATLFPHVKRLLDIAAHDRFATADALRSCFVTAVVATAIVVGTMSALGDDAPAQRWAFVEPVDDITALGFAVVDASAGEWRIEPLAAATGQRALVNHVGDQDARGPAVVTADVIVQDAVVRTRCTAAADHHARSCGVVFRYASETDHHVASLDVATGALALHVVEAGFERELAATRVAIAPDAWHEIEVVADGERVVVRHNGEPALEATSAAAAGTVGLWAPVDALAYFDELAVEPLLGSIAYPPGRDVDG